MYSTVPVCDIDARNSTLFAVCFRSWSSASALVCLATDPASWTPGLDYLLPIQLQLQLQLRAAAPARHFVLAQSTIATIASLSVTVPSPSHRVAAPGPGVCPSCTPFFSPCYALVALDLIFLAQRQHLVFLRDRPRVASPWSLLILPDFALRLHKNF